ncbi:hypothetical protein AAFF_G00113780 [Aldrovandia affinis]|uniref:Uncharacterized protein n=1 Tax=Aldrovandia affinis TaxID=143900 RepID=A0AAD7WBJ7_9TELE|nr:hypothetical protein AAFF_G00113780 [Aldrovandia affinis]
MHQRRELGGSVEGADALRYLCERGNVQPSQRPNLSRGAGSCSPPAGPGAPLTPEPPGAAVTAHLGPMMESSAKRSTWLQGVIQYGVACLQVLMSDWGAVSSASLSGAEIAEPGLVFPARLAGTGEFDNPRLLKVLGVCAECV